VTDGHVCESKWYDNNVQSQLTSINMGMLHAYMVLVIPTTNH